MEVVTNLKRSNVRKLIGIIADEETTIGFLLAGSGDSFTENRNFLMVKKETNISEVQNFFIILYKRSDIGIILVGSDLFKYIRPIMETIATELLPIVMEIPTKSSLTRPLQLNEQEEIRSASET